MSRNHHSSSPNSCAFCLHKRPVGDRSWCDSAARRCPGGLCDLARDPLHEWTQCGPPLTEPSWSIIRELEVLFVVESPEQSLELKLISELRFRRLGDQKSRKRWDDVNNGTTHMIELDNITQRISNSQCRCSLGSESSLSSDFSSVNHLQANTFLSRTRISLKQVTFSYYCTLGLQSRTLRREVEPKTTITRVT